MAENGINNTEPTTQTEPQTEPTQQAAAQSQAEPQNSEPEKKYTDDDVNKIINRKFAEWQKKNDEAAKLAAMNEKEKSEYEIKQMKDELASLKKEKAFSEMKSIASDMLKEDGVVVPDSVVSALVTDNAEDTKSRVKEFAKAYTASVQAEKVKSVHHGAPKTGTTSSITKQDIMKVTNPIERQRLIKENIKLFTGE